MKLSPSVEDTESLVWLGVVSLINIYIWKPVNHLLEKNHRQARRKFFMETKEEYRWYLIFAQENLSLNQDPNPGKSLDRDF